MSENKLDMEIMEMRDSKDTIIETIVRLMERVEQYTQPRNGSEKKEFVMSGVKLIIGDETYLRYQYFISMFIDFTIKMSRGEVKLSLNKKPKMFCCI